MGIIYPIFIIFVLIVCFIKAEINNAIFRNDAKKDYDGTKKDDFYFTEQGNMRRISNNHGIINEYRNGNLCRVDITTGETLFDPGEEKREREAKKRKEEEQKISEYKNKYYYARKNVGDHEKYTEDHYLLQIFDINGNMTDGFYVDNGRCGIRTVGYGKFNYGHVPKFVTGELLHANKLVLSTIKEDNTIPDTVKKSIIEY